MEGVIETGAANAKTIQAALEKMGFEGAPTEIAGKVAEAYEATEKYGGAFWDAAGGDYTEILSLGQNMTGLYAINATFGEGFAGNTPQQNIGSKLGQAAGTAVAGPFGAIAGGMMGAILGAGVGEILGLNTAPDYDFVTRSGDGGFEDGKYVTTPFGNFGFNAASTRDLSMNKQGSQILDMYAKALVPMDVAMASVMTEEEVTGVKDYMSDNITKNSHVYKPQDMLKILTRQRLEAVNATMSDQRKLDTGYTEMVNQWNNSLAGGYDAETYKQDPNYAPMKSLMTKGGNLSRVSYDNDVGVEYGAQEGDYILRDTKYGPFGDERRTTYNLSQAIRDGEFSSFEQAAMEDAMRNHYQYKQRDVDRLGRSQAIYLTAALDQAMQDSIHDDKRYAI